MRVSLPTSVRTRTRGEVALSGAPSTASRFVAAARGIRRSRLRLGGRRWTCSAVHAIANPSSGEPRYLAVYKWVPGADAYALANVITPDGTTINISAWPTGGSPHAGRRPFAYPSADAADILVDGPVTYCATPWRDVAALSMLRSQPSVCRRFALRSVASGATAILMANPVDSCAFGLFSRLAFSAWLSPGSVACIHQVRARMGANLCRVVAVFRGFGCGAVFFLDAPLLKHHVVRVFCIGDLPLVVCRARAFAVR